MAAASTISCINRVVLESVFCLIFVFCFVMLVHGGVVLCCTYHTYITAATCTNFHGLTFKFQAMRAMEFFSRKKQEQTKSQSL